MYQWSVFFHILIAMFWVGGMLFTAAILVPATRRQLAEQRGRLFTILGTRFSRLTWLLFPLLILTGITALLGKGFELSHLFTSGFWSTAYGSTLMHKLLLFALVLIISGLHDFWLGPKASQLMEDEPDQPHTQKIRKASSWLGRVNLVLGLIIVFFAVSLVR